MMLIVTYYVGSDLWTTTILIELADAVSWLKAMLRLGYTVIKIDGVAA